MLNTFTLLMVAAIMAMVPSLSAAPVTCETQDAGWTAYLAKCGVTFSSAADCEKGYKNYLKALAEIARINKEGHGHTAGLNCFAHWDEKDNEQKKGISPPSARELRSLLDQHKVSPADLEQLDRQSFPTSYDLRAVNPSCALVNTTFIPQDQAQCGSCWAFGTVAGIEYQYCNQFNNNRFLPLSQQNLVDCDNLDFGCSGGWPSNAYKYLMAPGVTLATAASYPYTSGATRVAGTCRNTTATPAPLKVTGYGFISNLNNNNMTLTVNQMKAAIMNPAIGILQVAIGGAETALFQFYRSGVYSNPGCTPNTVNHAVSIIGWGVNATTNQNYWIVRNQWGSTWGMAGYMNYLAGVNMCMIESYVFYGIIASTTTTTTTSTTTTSTTTRPTTTSTTTTRPTTTTTSTTTTRPTTTTTTTRPTTTSTTTTRPTTTTTSTTTTRPTTTTTTTRPTPCTCTCPTTRAPAAGRK